MNGNEHICAPFWLVLADFWRFNCVKISVLSIGKLVIRSVFLMFSNTIENQSLAAVKYQKGIIFSTIQ